MRWLNDLRARRRAARLKRDIEQVGEQYVFQPVEELLAQGGRVVYDWPWFEVEAYLPYGSMRRDCPLCVQVGPS